MRTIITAASLLLASIPLFATPTGLVAIPSTDIQPKGVWHLGVDLFVYNGGDSAPTPFVDANVTYGVLPRVEVGVDVINGTDSPVWGNAKVQLLTPSQSPVVVAAGIYNAGSSGALNQSVAYAVASTTFAKSREGDTPEGKTCFHVIPTALDGTRLTAGVFQGREEALGDDNSGYMVGLDRCVGKYWLGADYMSGKSGLGSVNVGVGYAITDKVGVILGYDNYNAAGVPDSLNFQFDWNL